MQSKKGKQRKDLVNASLLDYAVQVRQSKKGKQRERPCQRQSSWLCCSGSDNQRERRAKERPCQRQSSWLCCAGQDNQRKESKGKTLSTPVFLTMLCRSDNQRKESKGKTLSLTPVFLTMLCRSDIQRKESKGKDLVNASLLERPLYDLKVVDVLMLQVWRHLDLLQWNRSYTKTNLKLMKTYKIHTWINLRWSSISVMNNISTTSTSD